MMESIIDMFETNRDEVDESCQTSDLDCLSKNRNEQCSSIWQKPFQFWAPSAFLSLVVLYHVVSLLSRGSNNNKHLSCLGHVTILKSATAVLLAISSLVHSSLAETDIHCESWSMMTQAGIFAIAAALPIMEQRRGSSGKSLPLMTFWTATLLSTTYSLYSYSSFYSTSDDNFDLYMDFTRFIGVFLALFLSWFSEKTLPESSEETTSSKIFHPEEDASLWENLTLGWTTCMIRQGIKKDLEETDVPDLVPKDKSSYLAPILEQAWKQEENRCELINKSKASSELRSADEQKSADSAKSLLDESKTEQEKKVITTSSLLRALLKTYGAHYFFLQFCKALLELSRFIGPLLTAALTDHIQNRENESHWNGIFIVVSMFFFLCLTEVGHHRFWYSILKLSRHMRISTNMIIFKKSMTMKNECHKDKTNGEIVNLISDDCDRLFNASRIIFIIFMTPVQVITALYFLYVYLGWSMLVGVIIMVLLTPLSNWVGRKMTGINDKRNDVKDKRIKLMNEIINGIKVLKLYAWENSFMEKVRRIRLEETNCLLTKSIYCACIDSLFRAIPFLVKSGAFGTFLLLGGHLDATKGFVTISLFHTLNHPLSLFALLMPEYMEALVALKRINKFLNGEDISSDIIKKVTKGSSAVFVKEGTFTWEKSSANPTLTNVNVKIPKGGLVAVVGMVGSGKSSLLSSMLGEMEKLEGEVEVQGRVAYVPQQAWVLNASVQDNVLFGYKMDKERYRQVVSGCSLNKDIDVMAAGDRTEIGEKGINLSGGQKQRVSLARAVYNDANVYLLDDPLSAVDAHVGRHIFNKVLSHQGILKGKTRVLVTHGVHWLPFVDSIIVMKDGRVSETGTYEELLSQDGAFAQFLTDVCSHLTEGEDNKVKKIKRNIYKRLNSRDTQEQENGLKRLNSRDIQDHKYVLKRLNSRDVQEQEYSIKRLNSRDTQEQDYGLKRQNSRDTQELLMEYGFQRLNSVDTQEQDYGLMRLTSRDSQEQEYDLKRLNSRDSLEQEYDLKRMNSRDTYDIDENTLLETVDESGSYGSGSDGEDSISEDDDGDDKSTNGNIDDNVNSDSRGKLIDDEESEQGAVNKGIYIDYVKAIGIKFVTFFAFVYFVTIVGDNYSMYAVRLWTDDPLLANESLSQTEEYKERSWYHFYSFFIGGLVEVVGAFFFIMLTLQGAFKAANRIHNNLLDTILKCPMSFFDTTPSARVVNRFSSDVARLDGLGHCVRGCIEHFFGIFTCVILIVIYAPSMLLCLGPICGLYYLLHRIHVSTIRQLRRYRSKHRSPIFVHFSETLNGLSSIRAYKCQSRFTQTMEKKVDEWCKFDHSEIAVSLWFGLRFCFLYFFIEMVTGLIVVMDTRMSAGMAGLVLIYANQFSGNIRALIHWMTHMETEFVSLERILEYTKKPIEAPWEIPETKPAADWPSRGHVVLSDYKARYREGHDLVLKGVSCNIKDGEKIGIVGRTGAGKSSLTMALFRLIEAASGQVEVDSEKTSDLGLHDLRSKITILPQEPVIFAGTLRMNLDPFDKCSTEELWTALQHSHLKTFVEGLPDQLDFQCGEGGKNLSVGQRQLLCLARTLLRQTKILVLDEATAAVDIETDELIQKTIRTEFKKCTVLSIAHRLNTIMDYDRILVLDQGVVKEFDSPSNLLADQTSEFYSMAKDAKLVGRTNVKHNT